MKQVISDEILEQALIDFNNNMSLTKIAEKYNINRKTLSRYLKKKFDVKPLQDGKLPVDSSYFNVIDNIHKAYWLGFLYADGAVSSTRNAIELALKEEDKQHIYKFKEALKSSHKVTRKEIKNKSGTVSIAYRISIRDKQLKMALTEQGCMPNKSYIVTLPSIEEKYMSHFLRGFFEGDGHITLSTRNTVGFTSGSLEMLEQLKDYLYDKLGVTLTIVQDYRTESTFRLQCNRQFECKAILDYFYKDSTTECRLDRKYDKYLQFNCRLKTKLRKS